MAIVQVFTFIILILCIAWCFEIKFVEAIPVGTSLLVFFLYILSFFHILSVSDYVALATLFVLVFCFVRASAERKKEVTTFARNQLLDAGTLTAIGMTIIVTLCVSGKVVSWWDDYNFWATDVKSLFYLDGFAKKYANVAAEFGDYPPGTQMIKWWFLHFSPNEFKEGLMFAGYYFMNMSFLFPLLKYLKKKNPLVMILGGVAIWLFPAVAEAFWLDGCCADLTMAVIYGAFLVSVIDQKSNRLFYYGRQALYLMVLVLCKNTGFIWVAFGLLFTYGYSLLMNKNSQKEQNAQSIQRMLRKRNRLALLGVTLLPILTEGYWLLFCLTNRRVAKLTGTAIQMATGGMNIPEYQEAMVSAFVQAFIKWPLHRGKTFAIDLSPLALYLLLLVTVVLLCKFWSIDKKMGIYIGVFFAISGAVFYAFNLISHLTIFAVETQYLEPFGMVSSIERYGAPFTIGGLYLLGYLFMENVEKRKKGSKSGINWGVIICVAFVFLTTDYAGGYRAIWGYRDTVAQQLAERQEIVDDAAESFLEEIGAGETESIGRVLYLRDISDVSWVRNTYIGFEAAPVSVMYGNLNVENASSSDIFSAIQDAHAGFLYVGELMGDATEVFAPLLDQGEFENNCLYKVIQLEYAIKLEKVPSRK